MKIRHEDVMIGDYCWAMSYGHIVLVVKNAEQTYYACGPWVAPFDESILSIISIIDRPKGFETKPAIFW